MRMRRFGSTGAWVVVAVGALAAALWPATAPTVRAATATANVTAKIVPAISIVKQADLLFGELSAGATPGTVVIDPAGSRTATGGVTFAGTTFSVASFTVSGGANKTYSITLPGSITISDGTNTMTVDTFTSNPSGTGTLDASGTQTLTVGATLSVGANQPPGTYSGTFQVSVDYN